VPVATKIPHQNKLPPQLKRLIEQQLKDQASPVLTKTPKITFKTFQPTEKRMHRSRTIAMNYTIPLEAEKLDLSKVMYEFPFEDKIKII
jgi:hypothetical protein